MSLAPGRAVSDVAFMEPRREMSGLPEAERSELVRQGRQVLLSLGQRNLASQYCRLAAAMTSREELAELLLSCIQARHAR
jgi:hypothetical protein